MATSIEYLKKAASTDNIKAAIATIRHTEGTTADDGYYYLFGSSPKNDIRFHDLSKHPNIKRVENGIASTAAGIGQFVYRTWVELCNEYGFSDFSKETQHLLFCALFDRANCLNAIMKGGMLQETVMTKLSAIWASLPYSRYGQPTHSIADVRKIYLSNGGGFGMV